MELRGSSLSPWVTNWYFTIFWTRDPSLSECPTHPLVRTPFVFIPTMWTVYQQRVNLNCLLLDEMISLVRVTVLTDVSPDVLAESIAVDPFNRGFVIR